MLHSTSSTVGKKRAPGKEPGLRGATGKSQIDKANLRAAGFWLQSLRIARGLTQQDIAAHLPGRGNHFVSQVEIGWIRLPAESIRPWAAALTMPAETLAQQLMSFYTPQLYLILFGEPARAHSA